MDGAVGQCWGMCAPCFVRIHPFRLESAEVRYSERESRPEDLDAIRELKKVVSQQEFMLKEAIVS